MVGEGPTISDATRVELFRVMVLIRTFEDAILGEYAKIRRPHPAVWPAGVAAPDPDLARAGFSGGREPVAAGVCAHLHPDDAITATNRPHHLAVAHGVDLTKLAVEALDRGDGGGGARTGPEHRHLFVADTDVSGSGTIAEGYPRALGRAFAFQQRRTRQVSVAVVDRAEIHQDGFRDAINLANLWKLPLVFVIEDHDWGTTTLRSAPTGAVAPLTTHGVPGERVEDNAVETVYTSVGRAVERARSGEGPAIVEVHTVRLWRSDAERRRIGSPPAAYDVVAQDPLPTYEFALRERNLVDDELLAEIRTLAATRVAEALRPLRAEEKPVKAV
ncbi:thiamine pyrophosphate-dependent enzyme [Actinopolymorpha alba]|uniref:thiamine pyrophosphate-dependent enzyme n=1 Tax=Actinopolymorpha alba TaxID=533267 RepID=UPI00036D530C|nr:thiamine pyrophosphate-dependent enzyme [Actinopolymorpha alba]